MKDFSTLLAVVIFITIEATLSAQTPLNVFEFPLPFPSQKEFSTKTFCKYIGHGEYDYMFTNNKTILKFGHHMTPLLLSYPKEIEKKIGNTELRHLYHDEERIIAQANVKKEIWLIEYDSLLQYKSHIALSKDKALTAAESVEQGFNTIHQFKNNNELSLLVEQHILYYLSSGEKIERYLYVLYSINLSDFTIINSTYISPQVFIKPPTIKYSPDNKTFAIIITEFHSVKEKDNTGKNTWNSYNFFEAYQYNCHGEKIAEHKERFKGADVSGIATQAANCVYIHPLALNNDGSIEYLLDTTSMKEAYRAHKNAFVDSVRYEYTSPNTLMLRTVKDNKLIAEKRIENFTQKKNINKISIIKNENDIFILRYSAYQVEDLSKERFITTHTYFASADFNQSKAQELTIDTSLPEIELLGDDIFMHSFNPKDNKRYRWYDLTTNRTFANTTDDPICTLISINPEDKEMFFIGFQDDNTTYLLRIGKSKYRKYLIANENLKDAVHICQNNKLLFITKEKVKIVTLPSENIQY